MNPSIHMLLEKDSAFCLIQKQDSDQILLLTGTPSQHRHLDNIPRQRGATGNREIFDSISVIPFCQIRERGYSAHDDNEHIRTLTISHQEWFNTQELVEELPAEPISFDQPIAFDCSEEEYAATIQRIIDDEIGNGEGANFVIPRTLNGKISNFSTRGALSIFRSLVQSDYGTYWKFFFYDTDMFFIGSTPERHLSVHKSRVKMNPISGTFRKEKAYCLRKQFKQELLQFLGDQKEINELFMVVDEELKMMAKMCENGGAVIGPLLKEMSRLIHSEYLLSGNSSKDVMELFRESMFAATVVGSPVENSCEIIKKYSPASRRYYGSALLLMGRDEEGEDFIDSPIAIRTAEIDRGGNLYSGVGATLVKDSIPREEVAETKAKSGALMACLQQQQVEVSPPLLTSLYNDDEIIEHLLRRNERLSSFWFFRQQPMLPVSQRFHITLIDNEDEFIRMLEHMLRCMGFSTTVVRHHLFDASLSGSDLVIVGPGPGNPNDDTSKKMRRNREIIRTLRGKKQPLLCICLGHQLLLKELGFEVQRKARPLQGTQLAINLNGREELVGFYNTFSGVAQNCEYRLSTLPETEEIAAIHGDGFIGFQFHPESVLSRNGYMILEEAVHHLLRLSL